MSGETVRRMQARGVSDMQPSFPRLLGNLDTDGTRLGALARRMGTSRQAASQLLQQIEAKGFVLRDADPDDKRGVIVRFTPRGRRALAMAIESMMEIEEEYEKILGNKGFENLKKLLGRLLAKVDVGGELGLD